MRDLLRNGYKPKLRPSGHNISDKFQKDNLGAIPPNLIALANTESNSAYQRYCRLHKLPEHPARFPAGLPAFFIRMLTNRRDLVLDPFAGSCVTGAVAEEMGRRWICYEFDQVYIEGSRGRFVNDIESSQKKMRTKPYEIYPPSIQLSDEVSLPLIEDGGERRPKSLNRG
jgi:site-specific DNA-methyltransferase (cytosine-N4-specific)